MVSESMLTAAELEFLRTSSRVRGQYIRFATPLISIHQNGSAAM